MPNESKTTLDLRTATAFVIAAMIGTGVFTTLGFQVADIRSASAVMMLWIIGGVIALCGALTYGELGAALPRSGGEYNILTRVYSPALGFLAGWVSATVGFAGPAALAAMALASYSAAIVPGVAENHLAAGTVLTFSILHASSLRAGTALQKVLTALKVLLILVFALSAFTVDSPQSVPLVPGGSDLAFMTGSGYAVALIFVSYAYTGWNSAIYIVGELDRPSQTLPRALLLGTGVVTVLYVLLNYAFLYTVPIDDLAGQIEVGFLSGAQIFGEAGGRITASIIVVLLASTVSAYIFLGPRILAVMGEDVPGLGWLSNRSARGLPVNAFVLQLVLSLAFIYLFSFDQVLVYASILLVTISTLAVAGVYVLRWTQPDLPRPYRTWGYPYTPAIFLTVNVWMLTFTLTDRTFESLVGLAILVVGMAIYAVLNQLKTSGA